MLIKTIGALAALIIVFFVLTTAASIIYNPHSVTTALNERGKRYKK